MRLIDADALKTDLTRFYDNEVTAKRLIDEQPTIDAIPVDWMVQRMNETSGGWDLNFELNHALFAVGVEWERWKKEYGVAQFYKIYKKYGNWLSVKDRLPDSQTPVIVYVPPYSDDNEKYIGHVGMAYYTYSARGGYWAGTDGNVYGAIGIIHKPTHWMPMPEPPKEDNDAEQ